MSAFEIWVYGAESDELTDREKEKLAQRIHDILGEDFDVTPESVGIEGYRE
jgi:hypothetical protein